jgi:hypothetical protein
MKTKRQRKPQKPKISISVMAHVKREKWFDYLKENLGDVPFAIDETEKRNMTTGWENCKRALRLHDPKADFHLVVQDDALICKEFHKKLDEVIKKFPDDRAFQLYFGNRQTFVRHRDLVGHLEAGFVRSKKLVGGVAVILPVSEIESMIKFGDSYHEWTDDTKIAAYLRSRNINVVYPFPCLVDHRRMEENPTLVPSSDMDRFSFFYIDKYIGLDPYGPSMYRQGNNNRMSIRNE